jgi:NAD(P)-dependent dehydrogenase (short-subunit alcohol dehydrogenase family)
MDYELKNKRVLVTGAARGVGREIVKGFLQQGAVVVALDRDKSGLLETAAFVDSKIFTFVVDISDEDDVCRAMKFTKESLSGLDICVNAAAVAPHTALLEERVEVWDKVYAVNCRGTFLMTRESAKLIIDSKAQHGRIINFSSAASKRGSAGSAAYASSRAAVESFSRCAAVELAPYGILVNTISPGLIDTQPKPLPESMRESLSKRIPTLPLARAGESEEVVELTLFLASRASSYITGSVYGIDGGSSVGVRVSGAVVDDDMRYDWVTGTKR